MKIIQISTTVYKNGGELEDTTPVVYGLTDTGDLYELINNRSEWEFVCESPED